MSQRSDIFRRIKINTRRILRGDGDTVADAILRCPERDGVVALDACSKCGQCDALIFDTKADRSFIVCKKMPTSDHAVTSTHRAATTTPVSEIMTRDVVCVSPDVKARTLRATMLNRGFSGAPVVDEEGRPIGVVTKTDLIDAPALEAHAEEATVADFMMPLAFTIPEDESIARAAALMTCEGMHRLPVVSREGLVVGIVSAFDLVSWIARGN